MFAIMEIADIRKELKEKVKKIDPIGKRLKFLLDGESILIDGADNENVVSDQDQEADCTIIMSKETYLKLQNGEIKPMIATLTGKIKVKGDVGLAQKLKQLM
jgi:putative sterol carrier protein